ncbi:MAG: phosphate ABC transporter ATP-binding protein PstB [Calditrichia bacterium]
MSELFKILEVKNLDFYYSPEVKVLKQVNLDVYKHKVTALIGPSGCGKTTLLRCFNRIHDLYPGIKYDGEILFEGKNILLDNIDPIELRHRIGMVFQKPTPFPMSIFDNVAYGLRIRGIKNKSELQGRVETALKQAALFDEVKDRLHKSALGLSGGQQQRLVIARTIAVEPEVILMDEPASALDPISTKKLEETIESLKENYTILIVTHNLQQAARISDFTGFMLLGELIEYGKSSDIFVRPKHKETERYITGQFG